MLMHLQNVVILIYYLPFFMYFEAVAEGIEQP